jgi:hypothetical protein
MAGTDAGTPDERGRPAADGGTVDEPAGEAVNEGGTGGQPEHDPVTLRYPEPGAVVAVVGLGLLVYLAHLGTPAIAGELPAAVPGPADRVETAVAALLWVVAGATLVGLALARGGTSRHEFRSRAGLLEYLARRRPAPGAVVIHAGLLVAGAGAAAWLRSRFGRAFEALVERLARVAGPATWSSVDVVTPDLVWVAAFLLAVAVAAVGLDRLVVDVAREVRWRRATGTR